MDNEFILDNGILVKYLGDSKIVSIPHGVVEISSGCFSSNKNIENVILPDTITVIRERAFYACEFLSEINLPSTLNYIGWRAFHGCANLQTISIPESVHELNADTFSGCISLSEAFLPDGLTIFSDEYSHYQLFSDSKLLIDNQGNLIVGTHYCKYDGDSTSIVIPDGVKYICCNAAFSKKNVLSLTLPNTLIDIGKNAFAECKSLSTVNIPSGVRRIDNSAFSGCTHLATSKLYISENIDIAKDAFLGCCKYGCETVTCHIICNWEEYVLDETITLELIDDERIEDKVAEKCVLLLESEDWESILDKYQELIYKEEEEDKDKDDGSNSVDWPPSGKFNLEDLKSNMLKGDAESVHSVTSNVKIMADELDNNGNKIRSHAIPLEDVLVNVVRDSQDYDYYACFYVEETLYKFVTESSWHFALKYNDSYLEKTSLWPLPIISEDGIVWMCGEDVLTPVMWYGLDNNPPLEEWTVSVYEEGKQSIWYTDDKWTILNLLTKGNDYDNDDFLTWYFVEVGLPVPDISDVLYSCPIEFDKRTTPEELSADIAEYMYSLQIDDCSSDN